MIRCDRCGDTLPKDALHVSVNVMVRSDDDMGRTHKTAARVPLNLCDDCTECLKTGGLESALKLWMPERAFPAR
jgi:ribosomal protein S26